MKDWRETLTKAFEGAMGVVLLAMILAAMGAFFALPIVGAVWCYRLLT